MQLTDLIKNNSSLQFIDPVSDLKYAISDLIYQPDFFGKSKKLTFLYIDNSIQSISVFWTFFASNSVIALLNPQLKTDYKINLENIYRPHFIFDTTRNTIPDYYKEPSGNNSIFISNTDLNFELHSNLKILLSTSGTTGSPKFVKLSETNLLQNALSIIDYLPIENTDVTPLNLPVYYSYGLSVLTTNSIAGGDIICTNSDIITRNFWNEFEKFGFTSFAGVPFTYEMLHRIGLLKKNYPTLRYFTQAGGKLNEKLVKLFADYSVAMNKLFYVMYGQTEATARMSYLEPDNLANKIGSIGKPIKNGQFIIDDQNNELCYKGPNVFGGYAENVSDLCEFENIGVLKTGDIARIDNDGFYYIIGRLKRFTKIFGLRINLDEVENILKNKFPGVFFVCAGFNDKILFIGHNKEGMDTAEIGLFIKSDLNIHPTAIRIEYLSTIPLTSNGKVNYSQIQEDYGNR